MSVAKKKKHLSKKNKKAWKHCDIQDVEEFLEDQRLEERLGKFEAKADNELFVFDTIGADVKPEKSEAKPISAIIRKRAKLAETPKCFEVLLPSSNVQDPNKRRNHVNPVGARPSALSKMTEKRRFEKGVFQKKVEVARKNRKVALEKKKKAKQIRQTFNLDLWGQETLEAKGMPASLCEEFISPEAQLHNVPTQRRLRPKPPLPKTIVTRKAVESPHPGVSYNPSFQEHQELLQEVIQHEQKMIKREQHLNRVTTGMFSRVTQEQKENQWREEMSVGLPQPHNPQNEVSGSDTDNEYKAINPPVKNKKKDLKTRRKQRERLEEKERIKREKIDKRKITDIYRLRKIDAALTKKQKLAEELCGKRKSKRKVESETAVPKLNANKPSKAEPELIDPELLTGDLRQISATTNLLRDRYESLQRRGALTGAKVMMKKKRKLKSYFKSGHKVTEQDVQKYMTRSTDKK